MEVYDALMSLKRDAGDLEDENHELKAKLRFKGDDFEFNNPLWFDKGHPDRALCPKCFSKPIIAPVAEPYDNGVAIFRRCLSCDTAIEIGRTRRPQQGSDVAQLAITLRPEKPRPPKGLVPPVIVGSIKSKDL